MFFRVDLKIFIFLIIFYFTRQIEIYGIIMLFAFIHEIGHLLAGILLKIKVKKFSIMPLGFSVEFALNESDYNRKIFNSNINELKKIAVFIAGPFVNILAIIISNMINIENQIVQNIVYSNILILVFNMLPIYPLDGGRILNSILCLITNRKNGILYTNIISNIILFLITFLASILIYYLKNWLIIVMLVYLWSIVIEQNKVCREKLKLYEVLKNISFLS